MHNKRSLIALLFILMFIRVLAVLVLVIIY